MNKKQRHKFYKRMLEEYRRDIEESKNHGLCKNIIYLDNSVSISNLDELMQYKPKVFYEWCGDETTLDWKFWFPVSDTESRINLLKQVIKETEE